MASNAPSVRQKSQDLSQKLMEGPDEDYADVDLGPNFEENVLAVQARITSSRGTDKSGASIGSLDQSLLQPVEPSLRQPDEPQRLFDRPKSAGILDVGFKMAKAVPKQMDFNGTRRQGQAAASQSQGNSTPERVQHEGRQPCSQLQERTLSVRGLSPPTTKVLEAATSHNTETATIQDAKQTTPETKAKQAAEIIANKTLMAGFTEEHHTNNQEALDAATSSLICQQGSSGQEPPIKLDEESPNEQGMPTDTLLHQEDALQGKSSAEHVATQTINISSDPVVAQDNPREEGVEDSVEQLHSNRPGIDRSIVQNTVQKSVSPGGGAVSQATDEHATEDTTGSEEETLVNDAGPEVSPSPPDRSKLGQPRRVHEYAISNHGSESPISETRDEDDSAHERADLQDGGPYPEQATTGDSAESIASQTPDRILRKTSHKHSHAANISNSNSSFKSAKVRKASQVKPATKQSETERLKAAMNGSLAQAICANAALEEARAKEEKLLRDQVERQSKELESLGVDFDKLLEMNFKLNEKADRQTISIRKANACKDRYLAAVQNGHEMRRNIDDLQRDQMAQTAEVARLHQLCEDSKAAFEGINAERTMLISQAENRMQEIAAERACLKGVRHELELARRSENTELHTAIKKLETQCEKGMAGLKKALHEQPKMDPKALDNLMSIMRDVQDKAATTSSAVQKSVDDFATTIQDKLCKDIDKLQEHQTQDHTKMQNAVADHITKSFADMTSRFLNSQSLQEQLKNMSSDNAALRQHESEQSASIVALGSKNTELHTLLEEKTRRLALVEEQLRDAAARSNADTEIGARLEEKQAELTVLRAERDNLQRAIESAKQLQGTRDEEIRTMRGLHDSLNNDLLQVREQVKARDAELRISRELSDSLKTNLSQAQEQEATRSGELRKSCERNDSLKADLSQAQDQIKVRDEELRVAHELNGSIKVELSQAQEEAKVRDVQAAENVKKVETRVRDEMHKMHKDMDQQQEIKHMNEMHRVQKEVERLQKEVERLQKEIDKKKKQCEIDQQTSDARAEEKMAPLRREKEQLTEENAQLLRASEEQKAENAQLLRNLEKQKATFTRDLNEARDNLKAQKQTAAQEMTEQGNQLTKAQEDVNTQIALKILEQNRFRDLEKQMAILRSRQEAASSAVVHGRQQPAVARGNTQSIAVSQRQDQHHLQKESQSTGPAASQGQNMKSTQNKRRKADRKASTQVAPAARKPSNRAQAAPASTANLHEALPKEGRNTGIRDSSERLFRHPGDAHISPDTTGSIILKESQSQKFIPETQQEDPRSLTHVEHVLTPGHRRPIASWADKAGSDPLKDSSMTGDGIGLSQRPESRSQNAPNSSSKVSRARGPVDNMPRRSNTIDAQSGRSRSNQHSHHMLSSCSDPDPMGEKSMSQREGPGHGPISQSQTIKGVISQFRALGPWSTDSQSPTRQSAKRKTLDAVEHDSSQPRKRSKQQSAAANQTPLGKLSQQALNSTPERHLTRAKSKEAADRGVQFQQPQLPAGVSPYRHARATATPTFKAPTNLSRVTGSTARQVSRLPASRTNSVQTYTPARANAVFAQVRDSQNMADPF